uniref:Uncharacterized protein n=1 Tax=Candidozyma auris TaxID=498019 RepID=A0A0L0P4D4_CANAR
MMELASLFVVCGSAGTAFGMNPPELLFPKDSAEGPGRLDEMERNVALSNLGGFRRSEESLAGDRNEEPSWLPLSESLKAPSSQDPVV